MFILNHIHICMSFDILSYNIHWYGMFVMSDGAQSSNSTNMVLVIFEYIYTPAYLANCGYLCLLPLYRLSCTSNYKLIVFKFKLNIKPTSKIQQVKHIL